MKSNIETEKSKSQEKQMKNKYSKLTCFLLPKIYQFAILWKVHLLGKNIIEEFRKKHPTSRKALDRWTKLIEGSDFKTPQEIKQIFGGNVGFVGSQTVFDVGGNKVRAITKVAFGVKIVLVTHILTHTEYDKNKWKE